jgi:glycosyltransferase involved in cell wall biosynthesis
MPRQGAIDGDFVPPWPVTLSPFGEDSPTAYHRDTMRILVLADRFPPARGGVAASAARQAAALAPHLERLDVLVLEDRPPGRVEAEARDGVTVHRLGRARDGDESLQLLTLAARTLLAHHGHTLVHGVCAVHAGYVATWVARGAGLPVTVALRGNDVDRAMFHGPRLPFLTWTLEHADALLGVSDDVLATATALTGRRHGLHRVPNGVDATRFRPDAPAPADIDALADAPRPWLAFAGEARLKKGLPLLLELAERLAGETRGTLVLLGGVRRDARETLERWRSQAGAAARRVREVAYTGDAERLAGLYAAMDVFVFPSLWDGTPNAALEAMASGRPVVAAAVGGLAEMLEHGESGYLVPVERLHRFADEALAVLAQPAARLAAVGARARARVQRDFTPEAERDAILGVWRLLAK